MSVTAESAGNRKRHHQPLFTASKRSETDAVFCFAACYNRGHSAVLNVCRVKKCPNESCVGVTFSSGTMRLAAGSRLR